MSERLKPEGLSKDEIIYEADHHRAVALLLAGYMVRSPSARERIEREAERKLARKWQAQHPEHEGYVYVFAAGLHVKVGISWLDVERRWATILSSNPLLERPLYVSPAIGKKALLIERAAHQELMPFHVSGEWFSCSRELAVAIVKKLIQGENHA